MANDVLGILPLGEQEKRVADPFIDLVVELRNELRAEKKYQWADRLRDRLVDLGVVIEDGKEGTRWTYQS